MKLLIIEDNRDLVQVLAEGFAEHGFRVEGAKNGEEGLALLTQNELTASFLMSCSPDGTVSRWSKKSARQQEGSRDHAHGKGRH
jgi:DNA-binding response OmpR family regulator